MAVGEINPNQRGETVVKYGDITMYNVLTSQMDQEIEYDESGTDRIGIAYKMTFDGVSHIDDNTRTHIRGPGGFKRETAADHVRYLTQELTKTRKALSVVMDGVEVITATPTAQNGKLEILDTGSTDIDNGPKPVGCNVTHISSGKYFRISWSVECLIALDPSTGAGSSNVVSNRWSITETIDDLYYTTRTIRGRLRMTSANVPAHWEKQLVVPTLEDGFRRQAIQFLQSANGLDCDYEVIDKQVHTSGPWPSIRINGRHEVSSVDGVTFQSSCAVTLEGGPNSNKRQMINRGIQIVETKLRIKLRVSDPNFKRTYLPKYTSISDNFGDKNSVQVVTSITNVFQGDSDTASENGVYQARLHNLVASIGEDLKLDDLYDTKYDSRKSWAPGIYGYNVNTDENDASAAPGQSTADRLRTFRNPAIVALTCYLQDVTYRDESGLHHNSTDHKIEQYTEEEAEQFQRDPRGGPTETEGAEAQRRRSDWFVNPTITGAIVNDLIDDTEEPGQWSDDHIEALYTRYRVESDYYYLESKVQLPITAEKSGSNTTQEIVRLARPLARRKVRMEAERVGVEPKLPEPVSVYTDGDESDPFTATLLNRTERPVATTLSRDGVTPIHRIIVELEYALSRQPGKNETTRVGARQCFNLTDEQNDLDRTALYSGGNRI
jgi:hypothetical protein